MAFTSIDNPELFFNTVLYTGTGSELAITGVGFQPDWTWVKGRNVAYDHNLFDAVRGATKTMKSNKSDAESTQAQMLKSFDSDGFTIGTDGALNENDTRTYVAWNWKESATAGFDIVSYTGNGSNRTISHSLSAVPKMIIVKKRSGTQFWHIYHGSLGATKEIYLNSTEAAATGSTPWNDTTPTSSVFTVGTSDGTNQSSQTYIAYLFAEKKGYSKFGSFAGNSSTTDGVYIHLGFKAAWFMCKRTNASGHDWVIFNNKALGYNADNNTLLPNDNAAEGTADRMDILSNGVKMYNNNGSENESGGEYIFMAFAENPFVTSTGVPACAR